jgi:hypothetical protein
MKNHILNMLQTLWISNHIIWINQCISNFLRTNQLYVIWSSRWLCDNILEQYSHILKDKEEAWETCCHNIKITSQEKVNNKIKEIQILHLTNKISRIYYHFTKIRDAFR